MARKRSSRRSTGKRASSSRDDKLKQILRRHVRAKGADYLKDENVTSVGVGRKNGDGEICLVFTVGKKGSGSVLEGLNTTELPREIEIDGIKVRTDVLERTYHPSYQLVDAETLDDRRTRNDPVRPGISVSHIQGTAGTIGAIVFDRLTGAPCILSNWHVLHGAEGRIGDTIVQPGPYDDNNVANNGCGELLRSHLGAAGDCAISRIRGRGFDREIVELNKTATKLAVVDLDDTVIKSGRTTGVTRGIVRRIDVMVGLNYGGTTGTHDIGCFEIGVDPAHPAPNGEISMGGDSGAAWMIAGRGGATDIFAGLHFAGEGANNFDEHALACYPKSVQKKLGFVLEPPAEFALDDDDPEAVASRTGYDPNFLGIPAPMPRMSRSIKIDAVNFGRAQTIPYTHFSVCLSARRRLARFVAWNIDGAHKVVLGSHGFKIDDRIDEIYQFDNDLYVGNKLDRGHIARRADLAWGPIPEARQANKDSYFYTNIAPQHANYNQSKRGGLWGRLENLVLAQADTQDIRVSVIAGPIFGRQDPEYRGARIPREFWKLIAYRPADGCLSAAAFLLSQNDLLSDIERLDFDPFQLMQISMDDLSDITHLGFGEYRSADVLRHPERASCARELLEADARSVSGIRGKEVRSEEDLIF